MSSVVPPAKGPDRPRHLVITVHGIRTFGQWQERLSKLVRSSDSEIEVYNYHYGYFSIIAFIVPFLRWLVTRHFRTALLDVTRRTHWNRIDLVAHSFGTHLVAWGLHGISNEQRPKIHTIIFAGSVLKPGFPWRDIADTEGFRLVNDCGIRDQVLVLNQLFVLFSGMAGRVGFTGMTSERFTNRYFNVGHSGYFIENGLPSDNYMRTKWVPLLMSDDPPEMFDQRKAPNLIQGLLIWVLNNAEPMKVTAYFIILAIPLFVYARLYLAAEEQRQIALSRKLVFEARGLLDDKPDVALLLSVEASRRYARAVPFLSNDFSLSRYLSKEIVTDEGKDNLLTALLHYPHLAGLLHGHIGTVWMVAFSPDGKTLASASGDHTIRLWDVATRQPLGQALIGQEGEVTSVAFSPDGKTLASSSGTIWLWDLTTRRSLGTPLKADNVTNAFFSPDGKTLASVTAAGTLQLWDVATRQPLGSPLRGDDLRNAAFSPDGKTLAASWGIVAFSPDGRALASSACETIGLWDVTTQQPLGRRPRPGGHSTDGQLWICDATTRESVGSPLTGHKGAVYTVAFSPDAKTLASGGEDGAIRVWDVATHQPLGQPFTGHKGEVFSVAFSPDGKSLASAARSDRVIRLWDLNDSQSLGQPLTGHKGEVFSVAFSPDGKSLASGGEDHTIRMWDLVARRYLGMLLTNHKSVMDLTFSPDGKTLASLGSGGGDYNIGLWDLRTRRPLGQLSTGLEVTLSNVIFRPDGKMLASAGFDCNIWLWDIAAPQTLGKPFGAQTGATCGAALSQLAFSPDGQTIASVDALSVIQLWHVRTRKPLGQPFRDDYSTNTEAFFGPDGELVPLEGPFKELKHGGVVEVIFDATGKMLASSYADGTIQLWDVATQQRLGLPLGPDDRIPAWMAGIRLWKTIHPLGDLLRQHIKSVTSLAYSPDGKVLATGSENGTIWVWDVDLRKWRELACRIASRNLTDSEWKQYIGRNDPRDDTCRLN